jgi:transcriptional repressor OPI1
MEALRQEHPPAYVDHDPDSLVLPSVPNHAPPPPSIPVSLPDLKSLKLPTGRPAPLNLQPLSQWQYAPPNYRQPIHSAGLPSSIPPPSPMETESIMSDGGRFRAPSIMSLDDPETREAAETLSGLRNMGTFQNLWQNI